MTGKFFLSISYRCVSVCVQICVFLCFLFVLCCFSVLSVIAFACKSYYIYLKDCHEWPDERTRWVYYECQELLYKNSWNRLESLPVWVSFIKKSQELCVWEQLRVKRCSWWSLVTLLLWTSLHFSHSWVKGYPLSIIKCRIEGQRPRFENKQNNYFAILFAFFCFYERKVWFCSSLLQFLWTIDEREESHFTKQLVIPPIFLKC